MYPSATIKSLLPGLLVFLNSFFRELAVGLWKRLYFVEHWNRAWYWSPNSWFDHWQQWKLRHHILPCRCVFDNFNDKEKHTCLLWKQPMELEIVILVICLSQGLAWCAVQWLWWFWTYEEAASALESLTSGIWIRWTAESSRMKMTKTACWCACARARCFHQQKQRFSCLQRCHFFPFATFTGPARKLLCSCWSGMSGQYSLDRFRMLWWRRHSLKTWLPFLGNMLQGESSGTTCAPRTNRCTRRSAVAVFLARVYPSSLNGIEKTKNRKKILPWVPGDFPIGKPVGALLARMWHLCYSKVTRLQITKAQQKFHASQPHLWNKKSSQPSDNFSHESVRMFRSFRWNETEFILWRVSIVRRVNNSKSQCNKSITQHLKLKRDEFCVSLLQAQRPHMYASVFFCHFFMDNSNGHDFQTNFLDRGDVFLKTKNTLQSDSFTQISLSKKKL